MQINFCLGDYEQYPELGNINIAEGDVRVRKSNDFYCELWVDGIQFKSDNLELELDQGAWWLTAWFEMENFEDMSQEFKSVVIGGGAKLILGDLKFKSEAKYNQDI